MVNTGKQIINNLQEIMRVKMTKLNQMLHSLTRGNKASKYDTLKRQKITFNSLFWIMNRITASVKPVQQSW